MKTSVEQEGIANQYCNLGIIYKNRGELEKAEEFYLKSLEIYKALGRDEGIASSYANLGIIYNNSRETQQGRRVSSEITGN